MSSLQVQAVTPGATEVLLHRIATWTVAIRDVWSIDEARDIRDQAELVRHQVRKRGASLEVINAAAELKIRADRRLGQLLKEMPMAGGGRPSSEETPSVAEGVLTLAELGISYKESHRTQMMAGVPDDEFERHISETRGSGNELSTNGVLRLAERLKVTESCSPVAAVPPGPRVVGSLRELADRGCKFGAIYADPPWKYGNQSTRSATDNYYVTMSVAEICNEPVGEIAADNAHLHLWTTNAFLRDAFDVIEAWGFTYKSCFVWVKPQFGIGNYWRVSHEFLLLGVRGKCPFRARDEKSWRELNRGEHSAKPDAVRQAVEKVSPGPYLEMYGRVLPHDGKWTVYGNQVRPEFPILANIT